MKAARSAWFTPVSDVSLYWILFITSLPVFEAVTFYSFISKAAVRKDYRPLLQLNCHLLQQISH
jgi:hypothetical protein